MAAEIQRYNPHFVAWMYWHGIVNGRDMNCRYATWLEEDLPDVCPQCKERCELDGDEVCGECERDSSRGRECEDSTCEMCGNTGEIYVPMHSKWFGIQVVPADCECQFSVRFPYHARAQAVEKLDGLYEVQ